ncbi:flavin-containing monooxygenase [Rhodococcus opacus]|uniref:flavin-containing monooxygenase n=1 Tax=Rhodococcus opacus TaxID=37919 RepID=UPI0018C8BA09|nr:NAD(P)/FAD-dependent oxidoreductase [Rhodococcus opacus]
MSIVLTQNTRQNEELPDPETAASEWMEKFNHALRSADVISLRKLMLSDSWWRDILAFTWDFHTFQGSEQISQSLVQYCKPTSLVDELSISPNSTTFEPGIGGDDDIIQAFIQYRSTNSWGRGLLRLRRDPDDGGVWKAWTLLTQMEGLTDHPESVGSRRPTGVLHGANPERVPWLQQRRKAAEFAESEPDVVVIGAGQGGLALAARLGRLGVNTLLLDQHDRVGDTWRERYDFLDLHSPAYFDHLPYLPFPDSWPTYSSKDRLADWLELYSVAMELNVWTSTRVVSESTYDSITKRWSVHIERPDGSRRTLQPRHLVLATGMSGAPLMPTIPGIESFTGEAIHSHQYTSGCAYKNKSAIVVGTGNSGHDIAQDLWEQGVSEVTLVQRSGTYVCSIDKGFGYYLEGLYDHTGPSVEDADLIQASNPYFLVGQLHREATRHIAENLDRDLLDGLRKVGFLLEFGEDYERGLFHNYLTRGGGYYVDVGASGLIASQEIKLRTGVQISRFDSDHVEFNDGTRMEADLVVFATGYKGMIDTARSLISSEHLNNCSKVWGLDDEGEIRGMWRPSGQEHLWFMGGNLNQARQYSKFLALLIKASEIELI